MADQLLFGRLAHARHARPRRFRCFNAHLMHTVIFGLEGKLVENTSLSSLIISPRSLHSFWNFPRYANHRCTGHATMLTTRGNDRLITVHVPTTVSNIFFANSPTMFCFSKKNKPIQSATIDLTLHCFQYGLPSPTFYTQIQKHFVLASHPSQCFNPRQPARIPLNFPPNLCCKIYS